MQVEHDQLVGTSSSGARRADGAAQPGISSNGSEERAELERLRKAAKAPTWPKRARTRLQLRTDRETDARHCDCAAAAVNLLNTVFENGDCELS